MNNSNKGICEKRFKCLRFIRFDVVKVLKQIEIILCDLICNFLSS